MFHLSSEGAVIDAIGSLCAGPDLQLARVFDGVQDAMLVPDGGGVIRAFNNASEQLFGRPADRVVGTNVRSLALAAFAEPCGRDFLNYFHTAERTGKAGLADGNGQEFAADLSLSKAEGAGGGQYLLVVRELRHHGTAQRSPANMANLMRSARMAAIDEMSAAFTHKLNQPLTAALLYLQTIERIYGRETDGGRLPERTAAILDKAIHETERASSLLQGMRQFLEQGEALPRPIDLNRTTEDATGHASAHPAQEERDNG